MGGFFFRSFRLYCVVVCSSGLCSIVVGCEILDLFSVVSGVQQASVVSKCFKLFSFMLSLLSKLAMFCCCVACFWLFLSDGCCWLPLAVSNR